MVSSGWTRRIVELTPSSAWINTDTWVEKSASICKDMGDGFPAKLSKWRCQSATPHHCNRRSAPQHCVDRDTVRATLIKPVDHGASHSLGGAVTCGIVNHFRKLGLHWRAAGGQYLDAASPHTGSKRDELPAYLLGFERSAISDSTM